MRKVVNLNETPSAAGIFSQFAISIAIVIGFTLLFSILGVYVAALITGQGILSFSVANATPISETTVNGLKIIQIFSVIGLFIIPALLLPRILFKVNPFKYTGLAGRAPFLLFILSLLAYFSLVPLLDLSISLNQKMDLPDGWLENWMRNSEETNGKITQRFLVMPTITHLLVNVFVMALLPAIAEELFFRGFVQRTLYSWWQNKHTAVIISAAFFSFIHFQFYGFVPRMLLGMLLGYLLVWSGDLKLPIFIHFLNNFTSLLVAYFNQDKINEFDINAPITEYPVYLYFLSALAGGFLLYQLYRFSRKGPLAHNEFSSDTIANTDEDNWAKVFSTPRIYEAEIVAGNLNSDGIPAVIFNKKDSSYGFGEAEVFVHPHNVERALQIIPSYKL